MLTHAAVLSQVTLNGEITSQRVLRPAEYAQAKRELSAPAAVARVTELQKRAKPSRLVKLVGESNRSQAVCYWGGFVEMLDEHGVQWSEQLPQDLTAVAQAGSLAIFGDADGRVVRSPD